MNPPEGNDPLGYLDELREALASPLIQPLFSPARSLGGAINEALAAHPGLTQDASTVHSIGGIAQKFDDARWEMAAQASQNVRDLRENAFLLVSCLGFCRLYGIAPPFDITSKLIGPLPPELLVPAIDATLEILASATDDARELPEHFDAAEPLEDRSYCTSILHILMECWAVYVVIDEEYQRHLCADQCAQSLFGGWMHRLLGALAALDDQLQQDEQIRLLSVAAELPLLDNWRKMLVEPYGDPLPWWLDGTLEEVAANVERTIVNTDLFGTQQDHDASPGHERTRRVSLQASSAAQDLAIDYALAAAPSGLLGEITSVIVKAAANTGRDPLGVLRDLEVDEPRLRSNPVWCVDQLAASLPAPDLKRELYHVLLKHNIPLPPSVIDEMSPDQDGQNDE